MCQKHNGPIPKAALERFLGKVQIMDSGCWEWQGARKEGGYGVMQTGSVLDGSRRVVRVSRFAYETYKGAIPVGLHIDHLCKNPPCVNPEHLEAVTPQINTQRGETGKVAALRNRAKTQCVRGHPYDLLNTYVDPRGWRQCKACRPAKKEANYL